MAKFAKMPRVNPERRCPACGKGDYCLLAEDGTKGFCQRIDNGTKRHKSGFLHKYAADQAPPPLVRRTPAPDPDRPKIDWYAEALKYKGNLVGAEIARLARSLGLPGAAFAAVPLVGWKWNKVGGCFTFPEWNGDGQVIGIGTRFPDGSKKAVFGSGRGLTPGAGWDTPTDDPLWIVEGPSDVAAMCAMGLAAVGRPSNVGGVDFLAKLLVNVSEDRPVVILGEEDNRFNATYQRMEWPGLVGAIAVAYALASLVPHPIHWALSPPGFKDVRAWATSRCHGLAPWPTRGRDFPGSVGELRRAMPVPADRVDEACRVAEREYREGIARADELFDFDATAWDVSHAVHDIIDRLAPVVPSADLSAVFQ